MRRVREVYCTRTNTWMTPEEYYGNREPLAIHQVITDEISPLWHPATGEYFTSKRKFRNETKAQGCIEYGDSRTGEQLMDIKHKRPSERIKREKNEIGRDIYQALDFLKHHPKSDWPQMGPRIEGLDD